MNKTLRILGTIVGLAFIALGILAIAGLVPKVPVPRWAYGSSIMLLGIMFYAYGVTGRSSILDKLRKSAD